MPESPVEREGSQNEASLRIPLKSPSDIPALEVSESCGRPQNVPPMGSVAASFASVAIQDLQGPHSPSPDSEAGNSTQVLRPEAIRAEGNLSLNLEDEERYDLEESFTSDGAGIEPETLPTDESLTATPYMRGRFRDKQECMEKTIALMEEPTFSPWAYYISLLVLMFILISTITIVVETLPQYDNDTSRMHFFIVECSSIFVFTMEYCVRFWAYEGARWAYFKTPLNLIDFVAIIPFYIDLVILAVGLELGGGLELLRLFRLIRVLRIFKLSRYNSNIIVCMNAMAESQDTLFLMAFMLSIVVTVFSSFIFYFEHGVKEEVTDVYNSTQEIWMVVNSLCTDPPPSDCKEQTKFVSIPGAAWWTIVTMMTVGYGDIYPVTIPGKLVATVAMLSSIVILALPISVIGANFSRAWMERKEIEERYMDGHEVSIVYRNLINNLSEHNSILEDILSEGTGKMSGLQANLIEAKKEYHAIVQSLGTSVVDPRPIENLPPAVQPSDKLKKLLCMIDKQEKQIVASMERTKMVQTTEFNIAVAEAICNSSEMERVLTEQCMLSAKIESKEKQVMGRLLSVPYGP